MSKRAVIYVRTSSEHQGEKASPDEQEADCRKLADANGIEVVGVYRDTERYRSKGKLVDPSGLRTDRPRWVDMMQDGALGKYDVILAWREDRLYRGMRAMLVFLEFIQEHKLSVLLARENFDAKMAPIKAWVAGLELDGMRERMTMGVKARLRAGKANTGQDRYGYRRVGEVIEIVPEEADWVRKIFAWYIEGVMIGEIRRRLIAADAPQKGCSIPRRVQWNRSTIQAILKSAKAYATGIKVQTRDGEAFEIPTPPIIDMDTYEKFLSMRRARKTYPAHHLKHDFLLGGLIYCTCGRKWHARVNSYTRKDRRGVKIARKSLYTTYICPIHYREQVHEGCPRSIGGKKADADVWAKVCAAIDDPELLIAGARACIDQLLTQADQTQDDTDRLTKELEATVLERQWVITQARKGRISEDDMDQQLASLTLQEQALRRDLDAIRQPIDTSVFDNWEAMVREYLLNLKAGLQSLNTTPETEEEAMNLVAVRRKIIHNVVEKVLIDKDRYLKVVFKLNVLNLISQAGEMPLLGAAVEAAPESGLIVVDAEPDGETEIRDIKSVGICSRKPPYPDLHPLVIPVSPSLLACRP